MTIIEDARVRKILDSRGNQTIEVEIFTSDGGIGYAMAPAGASKGEHEVRDYPVKGIDESIRIFNEKIKNEIIGFDSLDQEGLDSLLHEMDGTDNFSTIGGNLAISISIANARAAADSLGLPFYLYIGGIFNRKIPVPVGNIIGGGKHAINGTTIQEFLVITFAPKVRDAIFTNAQIHREVGKKLREKLPNVSLGLGDEKAWVASISDNEALEILHSVIEDFRSSTGYKIYPAMDFAASSFYVNGKYKYRDRELTRDQQIEYVEKLAEEYEVYYIEDPLDENDFEGFAKLTSDIGSKSLIVGDDIFVTNIERLRKGVDIGAANAILLKPNQIGTLTDFLKTASFAKESAYSTVVSHRSGETEDDYIADIAVGIGADHIKTGTIGGERTAKLNQLIRIEEELEE